MSTITDTLTTAQDQVLEVIEQIQEPAVEALRAVVDAVESRLPEDRPAVPYADALPNAAEIVEFTFSFGQKVLDNQHELAKAILDAVSPLLPEAPAPKVTKPTAAKKAAA